jgi:small subunit ribosomal protein S6
MKNYEAMIVLDTKGKEETIDSLVGGIRAEIERCGGKVEKTDNLGKRQFPFSPRHVESGWFVNFFFKSEPKSLDSMRARLSLNDNVYQQYYLVA